MKEFMDKDFLLETETARHLFHDYAEHMPLVDYHCHINPKEIFEDRRFDNLAEVWLGGKPASTTWSRCGWAESSRRAAISEITINGA